MRATYLLSLGALGALAAAEPAPRPAPQITHTPAPQQSAAIASALSDLELDLGLGAADEVASVTAAIATAPPALQSAIKAALPNVATQNYGAFQSAVNAIITGSPTGFAALPTDVQSFVKSVASDEASVFNNGGAAPTSNAAARGRSGPSHGTLAGWAVGVIVGVAGLVIA